MMYFNLSKRNVKRSIKDYTIYFLTLTFGVCVFYIFNATFSQEVIVKLSPLQTQVVCLLKSLLSITSVFVSFILGFLILYGNNFLIKKRKKELGIYLSLGMSKRKLSKLMLMETLIIGLFSLITGLLLGIVLSQGLSALTSKLFLMDLSSFQFVFSKYALIKTILYFAIIFLLVMIFNTFSVSKVKLIDLLTASKKNEDIKIKNIYVSIFLFIVSLLILGIAYKFIIKNKLLALDFYFYSAIILGIIGTFLFFMSLSGFILKIIQNKKNFYFKNLNMFILRQLNSKINTTFVSMSLICLMLFFTIGVLSTGISIKNSLQSDVKSSIPYDVSFEKPFSKNSNKTLQMDLLDLGVNIDTLCNNKVEYIQYITDVSFINLFKNIPDKKIRSTIFALKDFNLPAIGVSDFNTLMELQGKKGERLSLKENETVLCCKLDWLESPLNTIVQSMKSIKINDKEYNFAKRDVSFVSLKTTLNNSSIGDSSILVLPDEDVKKLTPIMNCMNFNYSGNKKEKEDLLVNKLDELTKVYGSKAQNTKIDGATKQTCIQANTSLSGVIVYIGMYIGIIFLITSAAILALQQLSEAADNSKRYSIISKIGVDRKMLHKSIFTQILIYFFAPLSLALVHSVVAIYVMNSYLCSSSTGDIFYSSIITAIIICIIYGGYFFATYNSYKSIINSNLDSKS